MTDSPITQEQIAALRNKLDYAQNNGVSVQCSRHDFAALLAAAEQAASERAARESAERERDAMREALEPFVKPLLGEKYLQDEQVIECQIRNEVRQLDLRVSDFRRARAAIHSPTQAPSDAK